MTAKVLPEPTEVPLAGDEQVSIDPGLPWPSAYRGSKYSIIHSHKHNQLVMAWKYDDLQIYLEPPDGLIEALRDIGKTAGTGTGSVRFTANGEVLTKVPAVEFEHRDLAAVDEGWVPAYVGQLEGSLGFSDVYIDPDPIPDDAIRVWEGLSFHHGETWSVSVDQRLIWKWGGYRFESAFDHSELVDKYARYRNVPGRLYVNEYGHVWCNIPTSDVPSEYAEEVREMFTEWRKEAKTNGKSSILRLVNRRLTATGGGDPEQGHLPVYLGHASDFDDGAVPRTVVSDASYFVESGRDRED